MPLLHYVVLTTGGVVTIHDIAGKAVAVKEVTGGSVYLSGLGTVRLEVTDLWV